MSGDCNGRENYAPQHVSSERITAIWKGCIVMDYSQLSFLFFYICGAQEELFYKTREEQTKLLHTVLAANDTEAEEERVPGEAGVPRPGVSREKRGCLGKLRCLDLGLVERREGT